MIACDSKTTRVETHVIPAVAGAAPAMFEHTFPLSGLRPWAPGLIKEKLDIISGSNNASPETGGLESVLVEIAAAFAGFASYMGGTSSRFVDVTSADFELLLYLAELTSPFSGLFSAIREFTSVHSDDLPDI